MDPKNRLITLFLPSLNGGGVQRVMINLAAGLAGRGFIVDLVVCNASGPLMDSIPDSVHLVDLKQSRVLGSILPLHKYIKKASPSILISAQTHANISAIIATRTSNQPCRVIVCEHNDILAVSKSATSIFDRLRPLGAMLFYRLSDEIVAVSHGSAVSLSNAANIPIDKIKVIYNPLVSEIISRLADEPFEHPWLKESTIPVILAAGRLSKQKNFQLLIRSFARLQADTPARLIILGEGEERDHLSKLVMDLSLTDVVDLPGYVKNPYAFMKRANLFVLSSLWEGFPSVLVEAMACGTNVVSTNCPSGPSEILEGGRLGQLVPVNNEMALTEAIHFSLSHRVPSSELIDAADQYSITRALDQYTAIFKVDPQ
jgi:glycosyltransferase involved in cell wall biosynthesis